MSELRLSVAAFATPVSRLPYQSCRFQPSVVTPAVAKHECGWRFAPQCCAWHSVCGRRRVRRRIFPPRRIPQIRKQLASAPSPGIGLHASGLVPSTCPSIAGTLVRIVRACVRMTLVVCAMLREHASGSSSTLKRYACKAVDPPEHTNAARFEERT